MKFVPDGAYGEVQGHTVFTHGVELGFTRNEIHSLQEATQEFIDGLSQSNPSLARDRRPPEHESVWSQRAHGDTQQRLRGDRPGRKVTVFTTLLRDNNLFYCIAVAPQDEIERLSTVVPARGAIDPPHRLTCRSPKLGRADRGRVRSADAVMSNNLVDSAEPRCSQRPESLGPICSTASPAVGACP